MPINLVESGDLVVVDDAGVGDHHLDVCESSEAVEWVRSYHDKIGLTTGVLNTSATEDPTA